MDAISVIHSTYKRLKELKMNKIFTRPAAHRTQLPGRRDCGAVTPLEGPGLPWRQLCVVGQWHRNRSGRQRGTQVREEADSPPGVHGPGVGGLNCCAHSGPAAASATLPSCLDGSHTQAPSSTCHAHVPGLSSGVWVSRDASWFCLASHRGRLGNRLQRRLRNEKADGYR